MQALTGDKGSFWKQRGESRHSPPPHNVPGGQSMSSWAPTSSETCWARRMATFLSMHSDDGFGMLCSALCSTTAWSCVTWLTCKRQPLTRLAGSLPIALSRNVPLPQTAPHSANRGGCFFLMRASATSPTPSRSCPCSGLSIPVRVRVRQWTELAGGSPS